MLCITLYMADVVGFLDVMSWSSGAGLGVEAPEVAGGAHAARGRPLAQQVDRRLAVEVFFFKKRIEKAGGGRKEAGNGPK